MVFDVDPRTRAEEIIPGTTTDNSTIVVTQAQPPGDRIGSVLTGADGSFELSYEDTDYRVRNPQEQRPDLMLLLMVPEEVGGNSRTNILFRSPAIRQGAGRTEQYLIRLTTEQLTKAAIPQPTTPNDAVEQPNLVVDRLVATDARTSTILDGLRLVEKNRVERVRQTADTFHNDIKPRIRERLSRVPDDLLVSASFVAEGESVVEKASALIKSNIEQVINSNDPKVRPPVTGFVALTSAQKQTLAERLDADGSISAEALDEIINADGSANGSAKVTGRTTFLVREDPLTQVCRNKTKSQKDLEAALGITANGGSGDRPSPPIEDAPPAAEPISQGTSSASWVA